MTDWSRVEDISRVRVIEIKYSTTEKLSTEHICPICRAYVKFAFNFCPCCGSKIQWTRKEIAR